MIIDNSPKVYGHKIEKTHQGVWGARDWTIRSCSVTFITAWDEYSRSFAET